MNRNLIAAVALVAAGTLLFPTVAAPWTDDAPEIDGVVIEPSDGPNGVYAVEDENGQLAIRIDGENPNLADGTGVNDGTVTAIPDIFTITNDGDQPVSVWIETDVADVEFVRGTSSVQSIDGPENSVTLGGDESVHVGVRIHAIADHDVEQIELFEVVAEQTIDTDGSGETGSTTDPTDENDSSDGSLSGAGQEDGGSDQEDGGSDQEDGDGPTEGDGGTDQDDGESETADGEVNSGVSTQVESDQTAPTLAGAVMNTLALLLLALLLGIVLFWAVRRRGGEA
jgi:hypothetical protein